MSPIVQLILQWWCFIRKSSSGYDDGLDHFVCVQQVSSVTTDWRIFWS